MGGTNGVGFVHPALFYRGLDDYLAGVGGFLRAGLDAGEPVLASVPPERLGPLREYLGPAADRVALLNMAEVGRNPGRIMTALTDFAGGRGAGRARLVGEPIWATRTAGEIREATRHEALINLAFDGVPVTILCPYDLTGLPPDVLADATRTHPVLWSDGQEKPSPDYLDPIAVAARCDLLDTAPEHAERREFDRRSLVPTRARAEEFARTVGGLSAERSVDVKLAVGEAVANAIRHGGGRGILSLWRNGSGVVAEIWDGGRLADPLAGRRRPASSAAGGRGLWMIHQLCDLVEFAPGAVRLHLSD